MQVSSLSARLLDKMFMQQAALLMLTIGDKPRIEVRGRMADLKTSAVTAEDNQQFVEEFFGIEEMQAIAETPVQFIGYHEDRKFRCRACRTADGIQLLIHPVAADDDES